jgi:hypothetical protein
MIFDQSRGNSYTCRYERYAGAKYHSCQFVVKNSPRITCITSIWGLTQIFRIYKKDNRIYMPEPNLSCKFVRFVVKKLIKIPRFSRFA